MRFLIHKYKHIFVLLTLALLCLLLGACSGEQLGDGGAMSAVGTGGYVTGNTAVTLPADESSTSFIAIIAPTTSTQPTDSQPSVGIIDPVETTTAETVPDLIIGGGEDDDVLPDAKSSLSVDFLQTGKSDAMILRIDGKVILIDTGDSDDYKKISGYLDSYGINTVDAMIITHFDNDHVGTASKIVEDYSVNKFYEHDYISDS